VRDVRGDAGAIAWSVTSRRLPGLVALPFAIGHRPGHFRLMPGEKWV
jgi:hypothetical protein